MGAMYRLKAYFGMVPAEEMGEYADEPVHDRYDDRYAEGRRSDRSSREYGDDRWDDRSYDDDSRRARYEDEWDRRPPRPVAAVERTAPRTTAAPPVGVPGAGPSVVRGALAIDPDSVREPVRAVPPAPAAVPEQRDHATRGAAALARITTLQPRSYKEARTIGERYRDGVPVIMNLTELETDDAKRLVDFAAGLAFALRGSIDKVTNRVFLLTPADVEVSADDARRLAERGIFRQD
ncbi:cell division protein SepF [Pseudonocardia xinjiangensis]|uniref:Cell division protein SepF n=1 Tax=Pseudonocardia xinjiangensis TaxID=75289 RepID=A0ABX1RNV1_9PSEU|nr:cell division protein SepF [Pseudonocardia xinjiangensis]NMH81501.1 cell division protein SepF [Pseudonocardia xinjiangensis]